jgi:hypothetical protein
LAAAGEAEPLEALWGELLEPQPARLRAKRLRARARSQNRLVMVVSEAASQVLAALRISSG